MEMSEKVKRMDDLLSGEVLSLLEIDALQVSDMFLLYDVCCSFSSFSVHFLHVFTEAEHFFCFILMSEDLVSYCIWGKL